MKRRGITLIEVLTSLIISAIIVGSLSMAFSMAINWQLKSPGVEQDQETQQAFEDRITDLFQHAYIDDDLADTSSYFLSSSTGSSGITADDSSGATEVVFTTLGTSIPSSTTEATDLSFEERNTKFGAVGGMTEVRLGLDPIGDPGNATGLFIRTQTPSDEDETQGGYESVFDRRIATIMFEFYDGENWISNWDTISQGTRRIPAAVRITYTLNTETDSPQHYLIVRLPNSDISLANPLSSTGATP